MSATMERSAKGTASPAPTSAPALSLTLPRSVLREGLGKLLAVAQTTKASLPIASCVLIEVPAGDESRGARAASVRCTATDFETMLTLAMPAEVTGAGRLAVPAKRLADFVSSLPTAARVSITVDRTGTSATVRAGRSVYECPMMDASEFPTAPVIESERVDEVPAAAFLDALSRTLRFASAQESRPTLNTVCLDARDGALIAFATDGYTAARVPVSPCAPGARQTLLRRLAVPSIIRMFSGAAPDETLTITADEHRARIEGAAGSMVLQLVAGPYPTYRPLLSVEAVHTITCDRVELAAAVKRVALASNEVRQVILTVGPATGLAAGTGASELSARAASDGAGAAEDVVAVEAHERADGGVPVEFRIGASATYLERALDSLTDASVAIRFATPERAFLLHNASQDATDPTLTLVMPLRIV